MPAAWHWLAIHQSQDPSYDEGDMPPFVRGLLMAALVLRTSPEAWSNAIVALWRTEGASEDFGHAVGCARFLTHDQVLSVLSGVLKDWDSDEAVDDLMAAVVAIEPSSSRGFKLRLRLPDGTYGELIVEEPASDEA